MQHIAEVVVPTMGPDGVDSWAGLVRASRVLLGDRGYNAQCKFANALTVPGRGCGRESRGRPAPLGILLNTSAGQLLGWCCRYGTSARWIVSCVPLVSPRPDGQTQVGLSPRSGWAAAFSSSKAFYAVQPTQCYRQAWEPTGCAKGPLRGKGPLHPCQSTIHTKTNKLFALGEVGPVQAMEPGQQYILCSPRGGIMEGHVRAPTW